MPSIITSLEILPANGLQAVDGADAADANGWVAKITLPDDGASTFDPTKIVLTVSDPGFSAAAVPMTRVRTVRGGEVLRNQIPAGSPSVPAVAVATRLNTVASGTRTIYFSLADLVYAGSTVTANADAGYYGAAAAGSIPAPVNSSTRAYYRPRIAWASLQHERYTTTFNPELAVSHRHGMFGRKVAGVRFVATDTGSGTTGNIDVNAPVLSTERTQGNPFEVWKPAIPLANLTQGDRCILNAIVYPWLGTAYDVAASGVATTGDWSNANQITTYRFVCDKTGGYGGATAVVESGASGGAVQATLAAARTTPFPTEEAAAAALSAWNQTNKGHNDVGGADIYLRNVTGSPIVFARSAAITATAGKTWLNIRPDPANTAAVSVSLSTAVRSVPAYTRYFVPVEHISGNGFDAASTFKPLAFEGVTITQTATAVPLNYRNPATIFRNATIVGITNGLANPFQGPQSGAQKQQVAQAMGVVMETNAVDVLHTGMFSLLGCRFKRVSFSDIARATYPLMDSFDGSMFWGCSFFDIRATTASSIGANNPIDGFHFVNVLMEGTMSTGGGVLRIGGDGAVMPIDDFVCDGLSTPGSGSGTSVTRVNFTYADTSGSVGITKRVVFQKCLLHEANCKSDPFTLTTNVQGRTKNWEPRYGVGHRGNVRIKTDANGTTVGANGANWSGEYLDPLSIIGATVGFTNNQAGTSAAGGGTYTLTGATNDAYNRVATGEATHAYDLAGVARRNDGTGAAGAYERTDAPASDTTPDAFAFTDQTGVALSATITSNAITVAGINAASAISITGGTYSKNGGAYGSAGGTVVAGDTVAVRHTSSASPATATNTVLTIGGVSDTFTSTTASADTTPDAFAFATATGAALSTNIDSEVVTITGLTAPAAVAATGGTVSINGGAQVTSGSISNGQTIRARKLSSSSYSTLASMTVEIGGVSATFGVQTASEAGPDPITERGPILAATVRTIAFSAASGTSASAGFPLGAMNWSAAFDPADRTPFAIDWTGLLANDEQIEQIDRITMSAEGASLGIMVDSEASRSPIIAEDGKMTQFWFRCDEAFQEDPAFFGDGVQVGLAVLIRTDADPYKQFERTAILTVRQQ